MLSVTNRTNKRVLRGTMGVRKVPILWPDAHGRLILPTSSVRQSNARQLQLWPSLPRAGRVSSLHLPRSRSLCSWLLERSPGIVGFGRVVERVFEAWLKDRLSWADFGAVSICEVVECAGVELGLERDVVIRLLVGGTSAGRKFKSDGVIITLRVE
jgi:hypothetical protein